MSILEIGRGPESFHRQLVNAIFDLKVDFDDCGDDPTLDDAFYLQKVHDMKNGDKDMLLDANISESNVILAKIIVCDIIILSRFAAVDDFRKCIRSIEPVILEHLQIFARYFESNRLDCRKKLTCTLLILTS